jgi:phage shock protein A
MKSVSYGLNVTKEMIMKLLRRLKRVTAARIEDCVATLEDPELIVPQLVREMEDQVQRAIQCETRALADLKLAEREVDAAQEQVASLGRGARFALQRGEEAMTREAIAAQVVAEKRLLDKQAARDTARIRLESARKLRQQLQTQLSEMRRKKRDLVARARAARARGPIEGGGTGSTASIIDSLTRMETHVDEAEARAGADAELRVADQDGIESRLNGLERASIVEERLAALRASVAAE